MKQDYNCTHNYTLDKIIALYKQKKITDYTFFWGHFNNTNKVTKACLSQWYNAPFTSNGSKYDTAEQYMMAQKALLFNDIDTYEKIMKENTPKKCKALGRLIQNFSEEVWEKEKYHIVFQGNYAKFSQNKDLKDFLLSTGNSIIVEASPYDAIWGIKKSQDDKDIEDPTTWLGENLLGFALMEVRDVLRQKK